VVRSPDKPPLVFDRVCIVCPISAQIAIVFGQILTRCGCRILDEPMALRQFSPAWVYGYRGRDTKCRHFTRVDQQERTDGEFDF
jgi:hypothetical protein